jgi:phosphate-selective porin OprO/OprP
MAGEAKGSSVPASLQVKDIELPTPAENLKVTIQPRGRIEADAVMAIQSEASKAQIGNFQNGYGFRRARLGAQGTVGTSSRWVAEVDFAGSDVRIRDVYVGLTSIPYVREINIGNFREPFSLEGATTSGALTFMERSDLNQMDPTRHWGIAGYWYPDDVSLTFALGAFRTNSNEYGFSSGDDGNWAVTTRLTGLLIDESLEDFLHLGTALTYRNPPNGIVSFQPSPQNNLLQIPDDAGSPFIAPLNVPANSVQIYNLQMVRVYGSLSFQSEWFGTSIQETSGGSLWMHGAYAYVSYFLTGEHREYDRQRAGFDRVKVFHPVVKTENNSVSGWGAFEVGMRFSASRFVSNPENSFLWTNLYETTFGVNWYLNDNTRMMLNYTLTFPEQSEKPILPIHVFGIRTAIYW